MESAWAKGSFRSAFLVLGNASRISQNLLRSVQNGSVANRPSTFTRIANFGIGVFSYFMLADEIEIETCRLDIDGRPGQKLTVQISSGGSLFRMRSLGRGADAGTRI